jgi:pimeloyl-ACP methyl ester carboxylesterase
VKHRLGSSAVVFLGFSLGVELFAQSIAPRTFRAVAGESRTAGLSDGVPFMTDIISVRTTPPLEFPIRVRTNAPEPSGLRFVIPPATSPGEYFVEVTGRDAAGTTLATVLHVTVDAVTVESTAVAGRPPVILLNGFQLICTDDASTFTASEDTFGELASLLQEDGAPVLYFNNCAYGDISIEQLAAQLGTYIGGLQYTNGTSVSQVDLVAHSMGGLIARAYLAGKSQTSGVFFPPANPMVRKLVAIGTPHFGSFQAEYIGIQESEMALGNQFLWDLATWNQGEDDLRGVDALAIIGNAGTYGTSNNASDGVVSLTSGSLGFVEPDQRTRIVPYCHIPPDLFTDLGIGMSCNNPEGIAYIDNPSHLTAQIVRSFLANTTAWQSIGTQPSGDPYLSHYGGGLLALKGSNDVYFTDVASVQYGNGGAMMKGPSASIASLFYTEFALGGSYTFSITLTNNQMTTGTASFVNGSERPLLFKFGPVVTGVQSAASTGLGGLTIASGSTIYIYGGGLSAVGLAVTANGAALAVSGSSDQEITAYLPAGYNGLVKLEVSNVNGQHTVNIMTAPVSTPPAIALSNSSAKFAYTLAGNAPASQSIAISNSGGGTLSWAASSNSAWLTVSPASGTGAGTLTIGITTAALSAQTYSGTITLSAAGAANRPSDDLSNIGSDSSNAINLSAHHDCYQRIWRCLADRPEHLDCNQGIEPVAGRRHTNVAGKRFR